MNKTIPLDQDLSIGAPAANHTAKLQNKFDSKCSILKGRFDFALSMKNKSPKSKK